MKTHNFGSYWVTTDEPVEGAIESFEVTPEEAIAIDEGANLESDSGELIITEYIQE